MPLAIASMILTNGYLHRVIREQGGAYGGGAQYDMNTGLFRFYSYRDPRLADTFADFEKSIDWLVENPVSRLTIDEAILGFIGNMDKPGSPAGEARKAIHQQLFGRTEAFVNQRRAELLQVTPDDIQRVAHTYLLGREEQASLAVVTHAGQQEICTRMGLEVIEV
jgi:Zn-dependent M16 (insulinase) family peptidase